MVHKKETPLRPAHSIPESCYRNLNKILKPFFQSIEGADVETNSNDARKTLEHKKFENDEQILSLDVKLSYISVPIKEAINIALR